jgi:hypothetical protein
MSDVFVGDWSQLLSDQRLDLNVQVLSERYAEVGQIGIVANWRGDIQLARPRAFAVFRYLQPEWPRLLEGLRRLRVTRFRPGRLREVPPGTPPARCPGKGSFGAAYG